MENSVSRKRILSWLHRAEEGGKRVSSEFPELGTAELEFPKGLNALRDLIYLVSIRKPLVLYSLT